MTTRIILARHGESTVNVIGLASDDHENNPLTALGEAQAQRLAVSLRGTPITQVYTSPTQRARETGAFVASDLGLPISVEWGMEEIRVGSHAGERAPESVARGVIDFRKWLAEENLAHGYLGGENGLEVATRASAALERIAARHPDETVLVVAHGGSIAMTVPTLCDNISLRSLHARQLGNCDTVVVEADAGSWTCLAWVGVAPEDFDLDEESVA
jgi:broad specificity phosphatase PhoE